jgi:predicted RNase H-like nuclease (RuvC/YqgF family)
MRFIKKEEAKEDIKLIPDFHPVIENLKKEIDFLNQQIESLKNKDEFSKEKIDKLQKENKKYITEYSAFINDKLIEIEQLKQELHQQKSQKNQISIIKIFGIPFIKKTTKTIK